MFTKSFYTILATSLSVMFYTMFSNAEDFAKDIKEKSVSRIEAALEVTQ